MIFFPLGFSNHIIDVYFSLFMHHIMKESHHCSLIYDSYIFKPKWHYFIIENPSKGNKNDIFFVFFDHFDLIVTWETIHEGVSKFLCSIIYKHIDVREKWKIIFRASSIKFPKIHTYSDFITFHRYCCYVWYPLRVFDHF